MYKIEFDPTNSYAASVLSQTRTCRNIIEQAFEGEHRAEWGEHVFTIRQPPLAYVELVEQALGPLTPEVLASIRGPMPASFHVKKGRVVVRLQTDSRIKATGLSDNLHRILLNSSLGQGTWKRTISALPAPAIHLSDHMHEYFIPRLELPVSAADAVLDDRGIEDALTNALLAARINLAIESDQPDEDIAALPSQRIHVELLGAEFKSRMVTGTGIHYCTFTNVRFCANVRTVGEPMIGRSNSFGNGLLIETNQ